MIEFRILGPLEVVQNEAPLALGGQKLRALLGLLVLHAGPSYPRTVSWISSGESSRPGRR